jgi:hypothetical protein
MGEFSSSIERVEISPKALRRQWARMWSDVVIMERLDAKVKQRRSQPRISNQITATFSGRRREISHFKNASFAAYGHRIQFKPWPTGSQSAAQKEGQEK